MSGEERRENLLAILHAAKQPVSGTSLAKQLGVSRQVVVQDIALLRAKKQEIVSTYRGYLIGSAPLSQRIFKVHHSDEEIEEELNLFVDFGGKVEDVFIYHRIYNVIRVEMGLKSRRDVQQYLDGLKSGVSKSLKNITDGYHYHTITAESEEILDQIQQELHKRGFLARLRDYEPVDFWKESTQES